MMINADARPLDQLVIDLRVAKNRVSGSLFSTLISHPSPVKDLRFIHNTQTNNQKKTLLTSQLEKSSHC